MWQANSYAIHFNSNKPAGASKDVRGTIADMSLKYGDDPVALNANQFSLEGYTFQGWAKTMSGPVSYNDGKLISNLTETDKATINLYAVWRANDYGVNYNKNTPSGISGVVTGSMEPTLTTYDTTPWEVMRSNLFPAVLMWKLSSITRFNF